MKKAVLVTGASSGIGAATAIEFSKHGYFTYLMGRDKERLQEVASKCRHGASLLSCDLTDQAAVNKRLHELFSMKIHRVEALINNAGFYQPQAFDESTDEVWLKHYEVNVMVPMRLSRAFFNYFKEQGGGSIVNISSTLGLRPTGPTAAYSASKAALVNLTQSLALEGGAHNIRVNCICPGIVETPIHQGRDLKTVQHLQPLGRTGTAEEIAKSIHFLASENSSWTTGAVLAVDGGIYLK